MSEVVFITGAGIICPSGEGRTAVREEMLNGISKITCVDRFDASRFKSRIGGHVDRLSFRDGVEDRHVELALRAAEEAVAECGDIEPCCGVVFATAIGATERMEQIYRSGLGGAQSAFRFDWATEQLACRFQVRGPRLTITTGCTASIDALGTAVDLIRARAVDAVLVVSAEAPIVPITYAAFDRIGATSRRNGEPALASCPFSLRRDGFVLAEGAAAVVLESERSILSNRHRPLALVEGWASVSSAFHMTSIRTSGEDIERAMRMALRDAGRAVDYVELIDLHATSTRMNDLAESAAVRSLFGERAEHELPVLGHKSMNGHALGASNLIEMVCTISALQTGTIPPVANLLEKDPQCKLDVSSQKRTGPWKTFLKNSSGFSGIHTSMLLSVV